MWHNQLMAKITVRPIEDSRIWERFLAARPEANFLQSWQWGDFYASLGRDHLRIGFYRDDKLVGIMLSLVEPARRGRHLIVPGGPIIDWADKSIIKAFVAELRRQAKAKKCAFVRVRSQLLSNDNNKKLFANLGFRSAPFHLHAELTNVLNLHKTEEELLAAMRKKTRYEVRQAQKLGIQVTTSTDVANIKAFYGLQVDTAKRQSFVPFSLSYLEKQFASFAAGDQVILYTAKLGDQLLAQAFIIFYGHEAAYHYGASTEVGRQYPGAYLIQWTAIQEAKKRGLNQYNFWGVAPADQPHHAFSGVSTFKRGFGGEDIEYLHAHDLVINPAVYALTWLIETKRRHSRHV